VLLSGSSYGISCDGKLLVAGGIEYPGWINKNNVLLFDGTSWTALPSLNIARRGSGLAVDCVCNQIHIAAGSNNTNMASVETLFPGGVDVPCLP
jgi:hypothetical protein